MKLVVSTSRELAGRLSRPSLRERVAFEELVRPPREGSGNETASPVGGMSRDEFSTLSGLICYP